MWLSDYESEPDKKLDSIGDNGTTSCSSHVTTPYSSQPPSPLSSQPSSPCNSQPTTPLVTSKFDDEDSGLHSENDKSYEDLIGPRKKLHRTLSLPDSELNHLRAEDLQERFTTLQLEQENRELKKLTSELQEALEKLEERVNSLLVIENDSLDEQLPYRLESPKNTRCSSSMLAPENYAMPSHPSQLPQTLTKQTDRGVNVVNGGLHTRRKSKIKESSSCCVS